VRPAALLGLVVAAAIVLGLVGPPRALAQVPARFYWKPLGGTQAVPLVVNSISGNTNPFDPSHAVMSGADIDAVLALPGYAYSFSLFDRAVMAALVLPVGQISGQVTLAGNSVRQAAHGFGDPMLEIDVNVLGPRAQKTVPDVMRYEPGFSVDVLGDLAFPIGEYDSSQLLNLGQNRWYGRVGLPVVCQLGPWVPGRRTTLELLPAVWFFASNDDYAGQTLKTGPMFQLDAHLSRDLTERFWAALDFAWYYGGQSSVDGVEGKKLDNIGVGLTLGYAINDNLGLTFGYKSTINDSAPDDLRLSAFMVSLVYGWHPLIEGMRRLQSEEEEK
jgi:hypothetical protein